jgi:hypothetical protein
MAQAPLRVSRYSGSPRMNMFPWLKLTHSVAMLAMESQTVIGLRMIRLAAGGPAASKEASGMVQEKLEALGRAQFQVASDVMLGRGHRAPGKTINAYRRKVRANRKRLAT